MIINYVTSDCPEDNGTFYTPTFKKDEKDTLISIGVELALTGTSNLEASLNGVDWFLLPDTDLACDTFAVQTYSNADYNLLYRLSMDQEPVAISVAI